MKAKRDKGGCEDSLGLLPCGFVIDRDRAASR